MPNLCVAISDTNVQCNRDVDNSYSKFYCAKHMRHVAKKMAPDRRKNTFVQKCISRSSVPNIPKVLSNLISEYSSEFEGNLLGVIKSNNIRTMKILTSNNKIITDSQDNTLLIWDSLTGRLEHSLHGHRGSINEIIVLPSGDIASCSNRYQDDIIVWDKETWKCKKRLQNEGGHSLHTIRSFKTKTGSPGDQQLKIIGGDNDHMVLWDVATGQREKVIDNTGTVIVICCIDNLDSNNSDYPIIVTGGRTTGDLKIWDISKCICLNVLHGHTSWILSAMHHRYSLSYSLIQDNHQNENNNEKNVKYRDIIISSSRDNTIRIWDMLTGSCEYIINLSPFNTHSFVFFKSFVVLKNGDIVGSDGQNIIKYNRTIIM